MYEVIASEVHKGKQRKWAWRVLQQLQDTISGRMIGPLRGIYYGSPRSHSPTNSLPGELACLAKAMEAYSLSPENPETPSEPSIRGVGRVGSD